MGACLYVLQLSFYGLFGRYLELVFESRYNTDTTLYKWLLLSLFAFL